MKRWEVHHAAYWIKALDCARMKLVLDAFATVHLALDKIQVYHTDYGGEFNNFLVDEMRKAFEIRKSLSLKVCPYNNSVVESTFKAIKAECVYRHHFTRYTNSIFDWRAMPIGSTRKDYTLGALKPCGNTRHPTKNLPKTYC